MEREAVVILWRPAGLIGTRLSVQEGRNPMQWSWRQAILYGGVGLVLGVLLASDWPSGRLSDFWMSHPILAGVVSGVVLAAVGVLVWERYRSAAERKKWEQVAVVGFHDLSRELMLNARLLSQLDGERDYRERAAQPMSREAADACDVLVRQALGEWDSNRPIHDRLAVLYGTAGWSLIAYKAMQARQEAARSIVARWAPVMIGQGPLGDLLVQVAETLHRLSRLQEILTRTVLEGRRASEEEINQWADLWIRYMDECDEVHRRLLPNGGYRADGLSLAY